MADERVEKLASVLVEYSTGVRPGDLVLIEARPLARPLIEAVHRRVLEAGAHPQVRLGLEGIVETLLREGSDAQLDWVPPARFIDIERANARISLDAPQNTRALSGIDPGRQARVGRARKRLLDTMLSRAAAGDLRWTTTVYPTQSAAQDAEMSLAEYEAFVYGAGMLHLDDPIGEWEAFGARLRQRAEWLGEKKKLRIVGEDTDLTIGVSGRTWIAAGGKENFPDGEVFTGPVESEVDGEISFSFPAAFAGRAIEGIRLAFQGGEVVDARAKRGVDFLREMLEMDAGARRVGELAFGMNDSIQEYTRNTLFDEKIGGTVHLALGKSYPETGGRNESALHWDIVCDLRETGEVYADDELVYQKGKFLTDD